MAIRPDERARALILLLVAIAIWSGTFVVTEAALGSVGPFTILFLRFLLGFGVLLAVTRSRGFDARLLVRREVVLLGLTGMVLHIGLETAGLRFTSAASASLIVAGIPAATAVAAFIGLGERPTPAKKVGLAFAVAGVGLVAQAGSGGGEPELLGNVLVLGGVVAWAVYTVQAKRASAGALSSLAMTTGAMGAAAYLVLPLALGEWVIEGPPHFRVDTLVSIAFLGVFASAAAYALWNKALAAIDASTAGAFINLVPVLGLLFAVIAGESPSEVQLAGGALVGAGLWLTSRRERPRTTRALTTWTALEARRVPRSAG